MNGRSIPGFYWDPEKKKYFRIQANHVAPAGSQYSREAVKRRKLDNEQRQRQVAIDRRVRQERVRRSRCMDYAFTRLGHEIGKSPIPGHARKSQQGRVYVSQLQRRNLCSFGYSNVFDFARHGPSGALVAGTALHSTWNSRPVTDYQTANCLPDSTQTTLLPPASRSKSADVWKYDVQQDAATSLVYYELSSLSLCDSGYLLATYLNGMSGDSTVQLGHIPKLDFHDRRNTVTWDASISSSFRSLEITFWCSEARPNSSSDPVFAVGTSDGLQTIHVGTHFTRDWTNVLKRPKDVLAVEWLSPTVIASGFRDSLLFLSDLRSNDSVQRIKHPGMIGQIRKIDDYQFVVAGTRSLQTYDLRFAKNELRSSSKRRRRGATSSTKPYLVFDNYYRENHHSMDINNELGLLATTTEDRQNIRFYSLADGSIVQSPASLRDSYNDRTYISRIRFEEFQYPIHQRQAPRLLYAQGPDIVELAG